MTYELGKPETLPGFDEFKHLIGRASYHYADDSGGEWGLGRAAVEKAAKIVNENDWAFFQIEQAHNHIGPLVAFDQLMQAVLSDLRLTNFNLSQTLKITYGDETCG